MLDLILKYLPLILGIIAIQQFYLLRKEYKHNNEARVVPVVDINALSKSLKIVVLKFINNSDVLAKDFQIIINKDWLEQLKTVVDIENTNGTYKGSSYENLLELTKRKDNYLLNNQDCKFLLCTLDPENQKILNSKKLNIKVVYYKKNKIIRTDSFDVNLSGMAGRTVAIDGKTF